MGVNAVYPLEGDTRFHIKIWVFLLATQECKKTPHLPKEMGHYS